MKKERNVKTIAYTLLILAILSTLVLGIKLLPKISFGSNEQTLKVEAKLEKYIRQEKETLVQYQIKGKMEYEKDSYLPVKNSETTVQLNKIEESYPYDIKIITTDQTQIDYEYDQNNGKATIKTSQKVADEYYIICYYNTYGSENEEKDLSIKISAKAELEAEDTITIEAQKDLEAIADENIGTITSVNHKTEDIYNGYIKSNQINGTSYNTQYNEKQQIIISKKQAQENVEIKENSAIENSNLIYKSSKINKQNLEKTLGKDATLEILDREGNTLATINNETEWEENGTYTINYENEPEEITIKTSKIQNAGIIEIENTKQIKSEIENSNNLKIKTTNQITGINKEEQQYQETNQNETKIKEAKTNVNLGISNIEWTNKQQNEITFDVNLISNNAKDNMFKNPELKIELPSEVEKVILQNTAIFHENGLSIKEAYIETNENGNQEIAINLEGEQNQYSENALELSTDVKITATIILKKDIENTKSNINLNYTNQYTIDGSREEGNKEQQITIESYKEEQQPIIIEQEQNYDIAQENKAKIEGLKLEVATTAEETVYEGEYLKYTTKVTNTSNQTMQNVKVVANIPEGVTYAELEAEYEKTTGKYEYHLNKELKEKEIEIGTLKPGETVTKYYEVKVNDLNNAQDQKEITTNIKAYVEETEVATYETKNQIKQAQAKLFLGSFLGTDKNHWTYDLLVKADETKEIEVKLKTPKEFKLEYIIKKEEGLKLDLSKITSIADNVITIKMQTNTEYYIAGYINRLDTTPEKENAKIELTATAQTTINGTTYKSNENRIMYSYESVQVTMKSKNEGEEVKYDEEINYELTVKNNGKTNLNDADYESIQVNVADFLPENVKPISVTYDNWKQEKIEQEGGGYQLSKNFEKQEGITQEIYTTTKEGEKLPDINLDLTIPYGETSIIKIKTTAAAVYEKTKVENSATITGNLIKEKTSNVVTHTILPLSSQEPVIDPVNPIDPDPNKPVKPINPVNPDEEDPTKPINPVTPGKEETAKYNISGVAWLDANEDGQRQAEEKTLGGINIMLVDAKDASIVKQNIKTESDGTYRFTDIKQGDYVVVFQYDTNTYRTTEYQKNGVSEKTNSDATTKELTLNGTNMKVGVVEVSNLQASVSNMDIGLVENKICDFKLDKTISKVTVTTKNGTNQYGYQNEKLAKAEIRAKEIEGATVVIEYKIVVTNEGELPSTIGKVIDYLPEGLTFSSEMNTNWSATGNGQLINTSMSNKKIEPGKSIELTLIATKKMTANNTGTFTNAAEIGDITNSLGIKDKDSTPANKEKGEDDYSEATIIISVSTGIIIYISIGIVLAGLIGVGVVIASKYGIIKLGKISLFGAIILTVIATGGMKINTEAYTAPETDYFTFDENGGPNGDHFNDAGSTYFYGSSSGPATCQQPGVAPDSDYRSLNPSASNVTTQKTQTKVADVAINLQKLNDEIEMKTSDPNCIFGPFEFSCDTEGDDGYKVTVTDKNGKDINYTICDSTGSSKTLSGTGNLSFYIKVSKEDCKDGIARVKVYTKKTDTNVWKVTTSGKFYYSHPTAQDVKTDNYIKTDEHEETQEVTNEKEIEWTNIRGAIEIIKEDADNSSKTLEGVKIKVTVDNTTYTETTDKDGKIYIDNLPSNKQCAIVEIENPNYGYDSNVTANTTIGSGQVLTYHLKNEKITGNLFLEKKDKETEKALEEMSFKIKGKDGYIKVKDSSGSTQTKVIGSIYIEGIDYTENENDATEFVTDAKGKLQIYNLLEGDYTVIETSVGTKNYGYEVDDNYITWTSGGNNGNGKEMQIHITKQSSTATETENPENPGDNLTVYNERKYIKLSGYVWQDIIDGKTSERNDLFKDKESKNKENGGDLPDTKDLLFNNIEVRLRNKTTGEVIKQAVTSKLDLYTDVGNNGNGEYQFIDILKRELENYYVEFEYDGLTYTNVIPSISKNNGSKASETEQERNQFNENFAIVEGTGRETGITKDSTGAEKNKLTYKINEAEHEAKLNSQGNYQNVNNEYMVQNSIGNYIITANTEAAGFNLKDNYKVGEEELRFVNLGLYEREQPDMAIVKDIQNIRLTVNGYEHTYTYNQRFVNAGEYGGEGFNVGVKFGNKYNNMMYSRPVYKSDYDYINKNDKDKELKAYITYKLTIRNQSSNLNVQINRLNDYYDSRYQLINVGMNLDEKGNVSGDLAHKEEQYDQKYTKTTIDNSKNSKIEKQKEQTIYVQFKLAREQVAAILKDKDIGEKADKQNILNNIVEISSYSIFNGENRYAGIDTDSNPGNATPEQENTYEDDTDKAPALQLEVTDARQLAGKVFEDQVVAKNGEDPSKIMTAKIRTGSGAYEEGEKGIKGVEITLTENTGSGKVYKATTNENGDFYISNYIPGDYTLTYTWGDQKYTVQNYKGTIYDNTRNQTNKKWYKENVGNRLQDAIDNYNKNQNAPKGSRLQIDEEIKQNKKDAKITRTKMDATTPTMGFGVEYEDVYTASSGDKYTYRVENVDFGIVERARQDIQLTKRVKSMKATLANGQVIVDLTIDENGSITGQRDSISYMKPDENNNGFIKLELDNELIQGTKLEIEYAIKATNISELDYLSEKFYKYGIVEGTLVTIEPTGIIDYLDKNWAFDDSMNPDWKVITQQEELEKLVSEEVYTNEYSTIKQKTILYTEKLKGEKIEPGKSEEVGLKVAKTLTSMDEISLDNETEIVETNKPGGSKTQSTPGNYIPGTIHQEPDDDIAETTIVTPATGENRDYILPIATGMIAFITLGVGVIFIKKKVM